MVDNRKPLHADCCMWHEQQSVVWRCQYLLIAYEEVLDLMGRVVTYKRATWEDCCKMAVPP